MQDLLKLQQKIVPELLELLQKRYTILRTIFFNQPIGRRGISAELDIGERIIRNELDFFKQLGLVSKSPAGMIITSEGKEVLDNLKGLIHELKNLSELENKLKKFLGIDYVSIVPGDLDEDRNVLKELGAVSALYIRNKIKDNNIIALTGGTSVKEVVDNFPQCSDLSGVLVVPARGGIGKNVETLANTLSADLAKKIGASYKLLHIPDDLSDAILDTIVKEKAVKEVIDLIKKADILILGIGRTDDMILRRGLSLDEAEALKKMGAVGEAFGYYFNIEGKVVHSNSVIRIDYNEIRKIKSVVAVAGGSSKAEAIYSVCNKNSNIKLMTDEGAAKEILKLIR